MARTRGVTPRRVSVRFRCQIGSPLSTPSSGEISPFGSPSLQDSDVLKIGWALGRTVHRFARIEPVGPMGVEGAAAFVLTASPAARQGCARQMIRPRRHPLPAVKGDAEQRRLSRSAFAITAAFPSETVALTMKRAASEGHDADCRHRGRVIARVDRWGRRSPWP